MTDAQGVFSQYEEDTSISYMPSLGYSFGHRLHTLRFGDSVADFERAAQLYLDIKDSVNEALSKKYMVIAQERMGMLKTARVCMEEAQVCLSKYTHDTKLKAIIVFGAKPAKIGDQDGPYVRHEAVNYHTKDAKLGLVWHRIMLEEAEERFAKARRLFGQVEDPTNEAEAQVRLDEVKTARWSAPMCDVLRLWGGL